MISIGLLAGGASAADYYLAERAGCDLDYYTAAPARAGRWLGDGASALGLHGGVDVDGERVLRALLDGRTTAGERLTGPVLRLDPLARLDARPLVQAVSAIAQARGGGLDLVLGDKLAAVITAAEQRLAAGRRASLPVETVTKVTDVAGLDPVALYRDADGTDTYGQALPHAGARVDTRRAGLDVTVSAPKSVSVLLALADPTVADAVRAAHDTAVAEVVAYLQRTAATAVRGHHGGGRSATRIGSEGLIVAAFEHATSRAGDPQLHTHLVIPNLIRGVDGRWSALDSRAAFRSSRTASSVYHAVLRGELTRRLGVAWTPVMLSVAEIDGIPRQLLDVFSKRRAQIVAELNRREAAGSKAAQAACLATRTAKKTEPQATSTQRWAAETRAAGCEPETVVARALRGARAPDLPEMEALAGRLFGPTGMTADVTTFTAQDLARAVCDTLPPGSPVSLASLDELVRTLLRHPAVVPVLDPDGRGGRGGRDPAYTTAELLATEQHALTLAATDTDAVVGRVPAAMTQAALEATALSAEQRVLVEQVTSSTRLVDVVAGPAGCGKTAALALAHRLWAGAGHPVVGACVSWVAAQQLHAATGIPATSLHTLLSSAERRGLPAGVVVVIDEAGLVDTRTHARLLDAVHATGGKLVLLGDPHQLPEIGAGGLFAALAARPDTIQLTGNQRQHAAWERDALATLRAGDVTTALDAYSRHRRIHTAATPSDLQARVAADYATARGRGQDVVLLASRRADVAALNRAVRDHLIATGALGPDELAIGTQRYRAGERVILTANDHQRALFNGTRGTISAIDLASRRLELSTDDGRRFTLDTATLADGRLDHGYALTVHKAQGITVDTTLVYGLGPLTREHGYVALSRGRSGNHLYVAPIDPELSACGSTPATGSDVDEVSLTAGLLDRMSASRSQQLASPRARSRDDQTRERLRAASREIHPQQRTGYGRELG